MDVWYSPLEVMATGEWDSSVRVLVEVAGWFFMLDGTLGSCCTGGCNVALLIIFAMFLKEFNRWY